MTITFEDPDESGSLDRLCERARRLRGSFFRRQPETMLAPAAWVGMVCMFAVVLMVEGSSARQRRLEATTQMERLATMLSRARTIAPDTAREIARVMQQPHYSCTRATCDAALDTRNRLARTKLQSLLGR
jgi:hypothetical protein